MEPTDVCFSLTRSQVEGIIAALERFNARMNKLIPGQNDIGPLETDHMKEEKGKML
ncbi:MAG: hypothetical protein ACYDHG_03340 [Desulfomonilaceae bacterium]